MRRCTATAALLLLLAFAAVANADHHGHDHGHYHHDEHMPTSQTPFGRHAGDNPFSTSPNVTEATAGALLGKATTLITETAAIAQMYGVTGATGWMATDATAKFVKQVWAAAQAHASDFAYVYVAFAIPSSGGLKGDVGCSGPQGECYYTNSSGFVHTFSGSKILNANPTSVERLDQQSQYLQDIFAIEKSASTMGGVFLRPEQWTTTNGTMVELVSFVLPIAFDADNKVSVAAVVDLRMEEINGILAMTKPSQMAESVLIDHRGPGYFVAGSNVDRAQFAAQLYGPTTTPLIRINTLVSTVQQRLGGTLTLTNSSTVRFTESNMQYEVIAIGTFWTLIVREPASPRVAGVYAELHGMFRGFASAAQQIGQTYSNDGVMCYDAASWSNTSAFFKAVHGLQSSLRGAIYFAYMSYQIPNSGMKWGDCGCETRGAGLPTNCFYTDRNGMYHNFNGSNLNQPIASEPYTTELEEYTMIIKELTSANAWGMWQRPQVYTDPISNRTIDMITFTIPLAYNQTTGKATLAVSVDIDVSFLATKMRAGMWEFGTGSMVLLDNRNTNGLLVATTAFHGMIAPLNKIYNATNTPIADVNRWTQTTQQFLGGFQSMLSFANGNVSYNVLTFMGPYTLIEARDPTSSFGSSSWYTPFSTPAALSAGVAQYSLQVEMSKIEALARGMALTYMQMGADLKPWTANNVTQKFINAVAALQSSHMMEVVYSYASYVIPNTMSSTTNKPVRGDAGCQYLANGDPMWCYYTAPDGMQHTYVGRNVGPTGQTAEAPYPYGQDNQYQNDIFAQRWYPSMGMNPAEWYGTWIRPDAWQDGAVNGYHVELMSYTFPIAFNWTTGECIASFTIDLRISSLQHMLHASKMVHGGEVAVLDNRQTAGTFLVSSDEERSEIGGALYTPMNTPDARINQMMAAAYHLYYHSWMSSFGSVITRTGTAGFDFAMGQARNFLTIVARAPPTNVAASPASYVGTKFSDYTHAAAQIGNTYKAEYTQCFDIQSVMNTTAFFQATHALQSAIGGAVYYAYVSYMIPGSAGKWGDCGCEMHGKGAPTNCYYTDRSGQYHNFNGSNLNQKFSSEPYTTEFEEYTMIIKNLTKANASGVWQPVQVYYDPIAKKSIELVTFTMPLSYDLMSGKAISAVSIDIDVTHIGRDLEVFSVNWNATVALVDPRPTPKMASTFVGAAGSYSKNISMASSMMAATPMVYPALFTPYSDVNAMTRTAATMLSHYGIAVPIGSKQILASSMLMPTPSMKQWLPYALLTASEPPVDPRPYDWGRFDSVNALTSSYLYQARAELGGIFTRVQTAARALASMYTAAGAMSWVNDEAAQTFVNEVWALQMAHMDEIVYAYVDEKVPSTGKVANIGCRNPSGKAIDCYVSNSSGYSSDYSGRMLSGTPTSVSLVNMNATYLKEIMSQTRMMNSVTGLWLSPDAWSDSADGTMTELISYSFPIKFATDGTVLAAATIDIRASTFAKMLSMRPLNDERELLFFDARTPAGVFVAATGADRKTIGGKLYSPIATPIPRINDFAMTIWNEVGNWSDFMMTDASYTKDSFFPYATFTANGMQYEIIRNQWYLLAQRSPLITNARAAASAMSNLFTDIETAALAMARTYQSDSVKCFEYSGSSSPTSQYLQSVAAIHKSLGSLVVYSYATYRMPGNTGRWGDCGCQIVTPGATSVTCFYSDVDGNYHYLTGPRIDQPAGSPVPFPVEEMDYAKVIMNITNTSGGGRWVAPSAYTEDGQTFQLLTYIIPVEFDAMTGKCTMAMSVDLRLSSTELASVLASTKAPAAIGDLVLVDVRGEQGSFLGSTVMGTTWNAPVIYPATMTPNSGVNAATRMVRMVSGTFNTSVSTTAGGMLYNVAPFKQNFAVVERRQALDEQLSVVALEAQAVNDAAAAIGVRFNSVQSAAQSVANLYQEQQVDCTDFNANTKSFLVAVKELLIAHNFELAYDYVFEKGPSFSGCGCEYLKAGAEPDCSYIDKNGDQHNFVGTNWSNPLRTPFSYNQDADFLKFFWSLNKSNPSAWNLPEAWNDPGAGVTVEILTFATCFRFDASDNCIAVAGVDIQFGTLQKALMQSKSNSFGEMVFVDLRSPGFAMLASSDAAPGVLNGQVYSPSETPSKRINQFWRQLMQGVKSTVDSSTSKFNWAQDFSMGGFQYNSMLFWGDWVIAQRTPLTMEALPPATSIGREFGNMQGIASQVAGTYWAQGTQCWAINSDSNATNVNTTAFFQATHAIQSIYNAFLMPQSGLSPIYFTYVSYQMPDGMKWGDCGCETRGAGEPTNCFYTDRNGMYHNFNGANLNQPIASEPYTTELEEYTMIIKNLTMYNSSGVWQRPQVYFDPISNQTLELITFTIPLEFNQTTGKAISAVSIDIDASALSAVLANMTTSSTGTPVAVVDSRDSSLIAASSWNASWNKVFPATQTPDADVNRLTRLTESQLGGFGKSLAFSFMGKLYSNVMMAGPYYIANEFDLGMNLPGATFADSDSLDATIADFSARLRTVVAETQAMAQMFTTSGATCTALDGPTQRFIRMVYALQKSLGVDITYSYVVTTDSAGKYRDCGCQMFYDAEEGPSETQCYWTDDSGIVKEYEGWSLTGTPKSTFPLSQDAAYLDHMMNLTMADKMGKWLTPSSYVWGASEETGDSTITFAFPIAFGANGKASATAALDLNVRAIRAMLGANKPNAQAEIALVDTRGAGTLITTSDAIDGELDNEVYPPLGTPSPRINSYMEQVSAMLSSENRGWMVAAPLNFTVGGMNYIVKPVWMGTWTIVQRAPALLDVRATAASFDGLLGAYERAARTFNNTYGYASTMCYDYGTSGRKTTNFLQTTKAMLESLGGSAVYMYLTFALPNTNNSKWGDCGCEMLSEMAAVNCFYSDRDGMFHNVMGANLSHPTAAPAPFPVEDTSYAKNIMKLTRADAAGVWTPPSVFTDPITGNSFRVATFVIPFMFDSNGMAIAGAAVDVRIGATMMYRALNENEWTFAAPPSDEGQYTIEPSPIPPQLGAQSPSAGSSSVSSTFPVENMWSYTYVLMDARGASTYLASSSSGFDATENVAVVDAPNSVIAEIGSQVMYNLDVEYTEVGYRRNLSFSGDGALYTVMQVRGPVYLISQAIPNVQAMSSTERGRYRTPHSSSYYYSSNAAAGGVGATVQQPNNGNVGSPMPSPTPSAATSTPYPSSNPVTSSGLEAAVSAVKASLATHVAATRAMGQLFNNSGIDMPWMPTEQLQKFVNSIAALQTSHGADIAYAYLNFRVPSTGMIGDVGCKIHLGQPLECYWTNATAYRTTVRGSNILSGAQVVSGGQFSQDEMYLNEIMAQTRQHHYGSDGQPGIWISPDAWSDAENNIAVELLSYSFPIAFNAAGNVTVAFTIDMRISELQQYMLKTKAASEGEIAMIDTRSAVAPPSSSMPTQQGILLGSSDANRTLLSGRLYRAGSTPIARLNAMTTAALPLMYGSSRSYFSNGAMIGSMQYNVRNVAPPRDIAYWSYTGPYWSMIQRVPARKPANVAGAAVSTMLGSMELLTDQVGRTYQSEASRCYDLSMSMNTTAFFQATQALQSKLGNVYFSYISYELPGGNTSRWGDCGCETRGAGEPTNCFYTDRNGMYHNFNGSNLNQPIASEPYTTELEEYTMIIKELTRADTVGVWQRPQIYYDPISNKTLELITFTIPLEFDQTTGKCILAASVDVTLQAMSAYLRANQGTSDQTQSLLIDNRNGARATFLASSFVEFNSSTLYPVLMTPDPAVNTFAQNTYSQFTSRFDRQLSFSVDGDLYGANIAISETYSVLARTAVPLPPWTMPPTTTWAPRTTSGAPVPTGANGSTIAPTWPPGSSPVPTGTGAPNTPAPTAPPRFISTLEARLLPGVSAQQFQGAMVGYLNISASQVSTTATTNATGTYVKMTFTNILASHVAMLESFANDNALQQRLGAAPGSVSVQTRPAAADDDDGKKGGLSTGAIVGIIIGAVVLIAIVAVVVVRARSASAGTGQSSSSHALNDGGAMDVELRQAHTYKSV